ncbi:MAG: hypothetical protein COA83_10680 [Methylophaga sp.]|nr:MAG: hypothetical protein COA83_10680 [Methylophaga sp.]
MTIFNSIEQVKLFLGKLLNDTQNEDLLDSISKELDNITTFAQQLTAEASPKSDPSKPEIKSGCYIFADEKGFFCPNCYDRTGNKISTKRLNSQLRICPACRASIK